MQKANDLLNSYVFDLSVPDVIKKAFVEYCKAKQIKINQDKTVAPFTAFANAVATGNQQITFNFPDGSFGATSGGGASGATYNDSEHFLVIGIRLLTGVGAVLTTTPWLSGVTDPSLLGGRLSVNNNGTLALKDVPVSRFPSSTNGADLDAGFYALDVPIFWVGQTSLTVQVIFPVATAVANTNLRVELIGLKLI